jgi:hypothetical protein
LRRGQQVRIVAEPSDQRLEHIHDRQVAGEIAASPGRIEDEQRALGVESRREAVPRKVGDERARFRHAVDDCGGHYALSRLRCDCFISASHSALPRSLLHGVARS